MKAPVMLLALAACGGGAATMTKPLTADMAADRMAAERQARVDLDCAEPHTVTWQVTKNGEDISRLVASGCGKAVTYDRTATQEAKEKP